MALLVLLHLAAAATIFAVGRRLGPRRVLAVALVAPAVTTAWLTTQAAGVLDGATPAQRVRWVPSIDVALSLRLDGFALLMALVVAGIGTLVLAWSIAYFGPDQPRDRMVRFAGGFVAFAGAMLGLVLADDVWTLFVFWEATSITSFVLIGLDHDQAGARAAAQRALLITAAGGLALMGGLVLVTQAAGTTTLAGLAAAPPAGTAVTVGLVLVLVGAATKSAQVPFQVWLPGAMAAPTPVSAFLHSATMVKAGVILVGRFAPVFAEAGWWRPTVVTVGVVTMLVGGIQALRQHDAKLLLAHGTVSQLGFLVVAFGIGHPDVTAAAVALLLAHALFKAALFLSVGIVDHATGSRDIRRLAGVGRALPLVAALAAVAGASMAGLPPLLGFVAKEAVLETLLHEHDPWSTVAVIGIAAGSVLTVAYTIRLLWGLFGPGPATGDRDEVHHRPGALLVAPVALLAGLTVAGGLLAGPLGERLAVAGEALDPASHGHLVLWAGLKAPVVISAAIVIAGVGLHLLLARLGGVPAARVSGELAFQRGFDGVLVGARRVTGVVQNGSLPAYLAVVWLVVVAAAVGAVAAGARVGDVGTVVADDTLQLAVVAITTVMAVGVATVRRRFSSVLLLGGVGYGMAVLFMLFGAPDLALTQVLVETLTLVVFLLVLRQLPQGYSAPPEWAPRAVRLGIAVAVGLGVAGLAAVAGTTRNDAPVAEEQIRLSEPEAGGRNVVNVILVDFRGIDTLGEITVLAVAAAGVANLVRAARRDAPDHDDADPLDAPLDPATAAAADDPTAVGDRSVVFDVVGRVLFPILLLVSVYVTLRGHNAPGGGFAGGLVAGSAFLMRFLAAGSPRLARARPLPTSGLVGSGLLLAVGTGIAALVAGGDLLESAIWKADVPLLGELKLVTSTFFDLGVYLLVLGVVLSVLTHLGAGPGIRTRASEAVAPR